MPWGNVAAKDIEVTQLDPQPNYVLCTDSDDMMQLTDGRIERYPIWTRKGCVGWNNRGEVLLKVNLPNASKSSGNLRLHTARGNYAGVMPPRRIDIYAKTAQSYYHVAGKNFAESVVKDLQSAWITVPINCAADEMILCVRPNGGFLFFDEIEWQAADRVSCKRQERKKITDCRKDSRERFRAEMLRTAQNRQSMLFDYRKTFGKDSWAILRISEPYATELIVPGASSQITSVNLVGTGNEKETFSLGTLYTGNQHKTVAVEVVGAPNVVRAIKVEQLGSVLAANGSIVRDPIIPLDSSSIEVMPGQPSYLWFTVELGLLSPGKNVCKILLRDKYSKLLKSIPLTIERYNLLLAEQLKPYAVNWAYSNHQAIWSNPDACVTDLVEHGINVFVIHPSSIPMPSKSGAWDTARAVRLRKDLRLYKDKGRLILLYLGWDQGSYEKVEVQRWVKQVSSIMEAQGLDYSDWALYPIDEPCGNKLDKLREIASWIKQSNKNIQIYANPISTSSNRTSRADLDPFVGLIDYWQPILAFAEGAGRHFFDNIPKWIYLVPPTPAKSASPQNYYRLQAWKAWILGANGIGFWSYSDTSGSSAWDDLDGRRSDYAVVYEDSKGIIGSRRWEAFREGVEDYQLLQSVVGDPILEPVVRRRVASMFADGTVNSAELDEIRHIILKNNH